MDHSGTFENSILLPGNRQQMEHFNLLMFPVNPWERVELFDAEDVTYSDLKSPDSIV